MSKVDSKSDLRTSFAVRFAPFGVNNAENGNSLSTAVDKSIQQASAKGLHPHLPLANENG